MCEFVIRRLDERHRPLHLRIYGMAMTQRKAIRSKNSPSTGADGVF
jgi:hypothetical protein